MFSTEMKKVQQVNIMFSLLIRFMAQKLRMDRWCSHFSPEQKGGGARSPSSKVLRPYIKRKKFIDIDRVFEVQFFPFQR